MGLGVGFFHGQAHSAGGMPAISTAGAVRGDRAGDRTCAGLCQDDCRGSADLIATWFGRRGVPRRPINWTTEAYAATALPLLRRPTYCNSANTPVAIAWATTAISPRRFGETAPESSSAMLASVQAALPAITIATSVFSVDCRVPSQPTKAA